MGNVRGRSRIETESSLSAGMLAAAPAPGTRQVSLRVAPRPADRGGIAGQRGVPGNSLAFHGGRVRFRPVHGNASAAVRTGRVRETSSVRRRRQPQLRNPRAATGFSLTAVHPFPFSPPDGRPGHRRRDHDADEHWNPDGEDTAREGRCRVTGADLGGGPRRGGENAVGGDAAVGQPGGPGQGGTRVRRTGTKRPTRTACPPRRAISASARRHTPARTRSPRRPESGRAPSSRPVRCAAKSPATTAPAATAITPGRHTCPPRASAPAVSNKVNVGTKAPISRTDPARTATATTR